jgi:hypothetical protein
MTSIPYVISEDVHVLLGHWASARGFQLPSPEFFRDMRSEMKKQLLRYFPVVEFVSEISFSKEFRRLLHETRHKLVSLDETYYPNGHFAIRMTRLIDRNFKNLILPDASSEGSRNGIPLSRQIDAIASAFGEAGGTVELIDDVVFSGGGIVRRIRELAARNIRVARVMTGVLVGAGKDAIQSEFPDVVVDAVCYYPEVIDEICERDFYVGVPLSGRTIGKIIDGEGLPTEPQVGVPYLAPFATPETFFDWTSIDQKHFFDWSSFCLRQSMLLWRAIELINGRSVHCSDFDRLPIGFSPDGEIVAELAEVLNHLEVSV